MNNLRSAAVLAGRLALAWIFLLEGAEKLAHYAAVGAYMEANGVTSAVLPLAILTELAGGVLIVVGFFTRFAAAALAGFCLLTAIVFHWNFADADQLIHFNKNIAMAGGFLVLVAFGGGAWSLDAFTHRLALWPGRL